MRIDMDSLNPNKTGWYAAMLCSALIIFIYRYTTTFKQTRLAFHLLRLSTTVALSIFFGLFLLWSQSRAAWLAFSTIIILFLFILLFQGDNKGRSKLIKSAIVLAPLAVCLYIVMQFNIVQNRIAFESDTIQSITTEQVSELPMDSVGIRLKLWEYGMEKFQQRPLLGWGLGTMNTHLSMHTDGVANHLHNFYLETLVGLGLIGTTLLLLNIALISRMAWLAYQRGAMEKDMGTLLLALSIITVIFQFFSTHLGTHGKFLLILLGGLACTYRFSGSTSQTEKAPSNLKDEH
jgi:O-antigen ligase